MNRTILKQSGKGYPHYYVVSGEHFLDALPASLLAEKKGSGILYTRSGNVNNLRNQVKFAMDQKVNKFTFIGGNNTLSKQTFQAFRQPGRHL